MDSILALLLALWRNEAIQVTLMAIGGVALLCLAAFILTLVLMALRP